MLLFAWPLSAKDRPKTASTPYFQGMNVGLEFGGGLKRLLSDNWSTSANLDLNIKNKLMPTVEVGRAHLEMTGETGAFYTTTGTFIKAGFNKPLVYSVSGRDMFYVGLHYGFSAFDYDLTNLTFSEGYWGQPGVTSLLGEHAAAGWFDAVAGVRVQVLGPISLGWSIHYRSVLHVSNGSSSVPQYIPGYGQNVKPFAGIDAHIYYRLPF
jgi:hypothetical protein